MRQISPKIAGGDLTAILYTLTSVRFIMDHIACVRSIQKTLRSTGAFSYLCENLPTMREGFARERTLPCNGALISKERPGVPNFSNHGALNNCLEQTSIYYRVIY